MPTRTKAGWVGASGSQRRMSRKRASPASFARDAISAAASGLPGARPWVALSTSSAGRTVKPRWASWTRASEASTSGTVTRSLLSAYFSRKDVPATSSGSPVRLAGARTATVRTMSGGGGVAVERRARSPRRRHGVGGGQESAGALRQGVRERRQRLAREPVLVPRGAHAREPGREELDERAIVGVEGPVRDELAGGREVAKGQHREPLWGREQRVAAPRGEGPEPLADTVEVDRARGEPADEPDHRPIGVEVVPPQAHLGEHGEKRPRDRVELLVRQLVER